MICLCLYGAAAARMSPYSSLITPKVDIKTTSEPVAKISSKWHFGVSGCIQTYVIMVYQAPFCAFPHGWFGPVSISWWRHQMETFSALLAICAGKSPVSGEFPIQRPVTRSFDIFFDLRLNKRLSKQSWSWWFETPSCPLWRQCNVKTVCPGMEIPTIKVRRETVFSL